jgi:hypothetical protein
MVSPTLHFKPFIRVWIYVPVNSNCDILPPPGLITHRREFDANLGQPRQAFDSVRGRTKLVGGCTQKNHNLQSIFTHLLLIFRINMWWLMICSFSTNTHIHITFLPAPWGIWRWFSPAQWGIWPKFFEKSNSWGFAGRGDDRSWNWLVHYTYITFNWNYFISADQPNNG